MNKKYLLLTTYILVFTFLYTLPLFVPSLMPKNIPPKDFHTGKYSLYSLNYLDEVNNNYNFETISKKEFTYLYGSGNISNKFLIVETVQDEKLTYSSLFYTNKLIVENSIVLFTNSQDIYIDQDIDIEMTNSIFLLVNNFINFTNFKVNVNINNSNFYFKSEDINKYESIIISNSPDIASSTENKYNFINNYQIDNIYIKSSYYIN